MRTRLIVTCNLCVHAPFPTMQKAQRHMFKIHKIRDKPTMRANLTLGKEIKEGDPGFGS